MAGHVVTKCEDQTALHCLVMSSDISHWIRLTMHLEPLRMHHITWATCMCRPIGAIFFILTNVVCYQTRCVRHFYLSIGQCHCPRGYHVRACITGSSALHCISSYRSRLVYCFVSSNYIFGLPFIFCHASASIITNTWTHCLRCLLYTSDAADE